jgi:SET domain-containing protein
MKSNNVIVKKSKIEGRGVFANRDFKKGEVIFEWGNIILTKEEVKNLSENKKKRVFLFQGKPHLQQPPARFLNHSCSPNTKVVNGSSDVAIKDIKKGEEITSDYPAFLPMDKIIKCNCKSKNCKNTI